MRPSWYLKLGGLIYFVIAACILMVLLFWGSVSTRQIDGSIVGTGIVLGSICIFFGYKVIRADTASIEARRRLTIYAGVFCGGAASIGGVFAGVIFGVPLIITMLGMPEMRKFSKKVQKKFDTILR